MTNPSEPDLTTSEQLDEDELGTDPLEQGAEPRDDWSQDDGVPATRREQREGISHDDRLAQEEPDVSDRG